MGGKPECPTSAEKHNRHNPEPNAAPVIGSAADHLQDNKAAHTRKIKVTVRERNSANYRNKKTLYLHQRRSLTTANLLVRPA